MNELKKQLYEKCLHHVDLRVTTANKAMKAAQEAANEESKSSAGDKFETGRAMMQQERDKNARQLGEAIQIKQTLHQINWQKNYTSAELGSVVQTNKGHFFLSISIGKILIDQTTYFAISMATPIGRLLQGKKIGETILFNGKEYLIEKVF